MKGFKLFKNDTYLLCLWWLTEANLIFCLDEMKKNHVIYYLLKLLKFSDFIRKITFCPNLNYLVEI